MWEGEVWKVGGALQRGGATPGFPFLTWSTLPAPSDLALRNCLLTSDLTVRIGDYGLAHSNYKVGAAIRRDWVGAVGVTRPA